MRLPFLLLPLLASPFALGQPTDAPSMHVTGRLLSVNGATEIPRGLFGVHATPLSPERVQEWGIESTRQIYQEPSGTPAQPGRTKNVPEGIALVVECFYDRYQPAWLLHDPDWEKRLVSLASRYGENSRELPGPHCVEFWNEPYLNWAVKPGVNYDGVFYEEEGRVEGGPMTLKGQSQPLEHLVWDKKLVAVGDNGMVDYLASSYAIPLIQKGELHEGDSYNFRDQKILRIEERWWGRDPTQKSYYSGQQNRLFYERMLLPFAKALKEADPEVALVVGWDFHIFQGDWDAWESLNKPLIDGFWQWIDGLTEHHYGEDTRRVAASYETVWAYAQSRYHKALRFYNTEAGGQLDPQRPDTVAAPVFQPKTIDDEIGSLTYMLRDVIYLLQWMPDKAVARAAHSAEMSVGVEHAFKLMKHLRGRLVEVRATQRDVWGVASLDGEWLNLVAFNDSTETMSLPIRVDAPEGTRFAGEGEVLRVMPEPPDEAPDAKPAMRVDRESIQTADSQWRAEVELAGRSAMAWRFKITGAAPAEPQLFLRQYPAKEILTRLAPGDSVSMQISLPEKELAGAKGAHLRLAQQALADGLQATLNGESIPLTLRGAILSRHSIDRAKLHTTNELTFSLPANAKSGGILNSASLVLEADR